MHKFVIGMYEVIKELLAEKAPLVVFIALLLIIFFMPDVAQAIAAGE